MAETKSRNFFADSRAPCTATLKLKVQAKIWTIWPVFSNSLSVSYDYVLKEASHCCKESFSLKSIFL